MTRVVSIVKKDFDTAVNDLLMGIEADYVNWCNGHPHKMDEMRLTEGSKYVKVIRGNSVWGFIAKKSGVLKGIPYGIGDVFKPAGWSAPAKHVRGNIFSGKDNWYSWTGPRYL
jgi:hypothetical protein